MISFPVTAADLEDVAQLVNSAYRGESSRRGWTTEADLIGGQRTDADTLAAELSDNPRQTILGFRQNLGGPLVGCVNLEFFDSDANRLCCYLGMLTVNPTLQNSGIGRKILKVAESYAASRGALEMHLGVIFVRESLMAWYERRGYRKTGQREPFPYGNDKAGAPVRDDLYFVLFSKKL